jgi:hypothetical protein
VSGYLAIREASDRLRAVLGDSFASDPTARQYVANAEAIGYESPGQSQDDASHSLSLWLFGVTDNGFARNAPPRPRRSGQDATPMLPINLHYLITPSTQSAEGDLIAIGKILQTFAETPVISMQNDADGIFDELRLIRGHLGNEDISHLWGTLQTPYRLSLYYEARLTEIDLPSTSSGGRVVHRGTANPVPS